MKEKEKDPAYLMEIKQALGPKCACYVLITCSDPSEKGEMDVEMHFEGDECLASLLVDNANKIFKERVALE